MQDPGPYAIRGAQGEAELTSILSLQAKNLASNLSQQAREEQGFVTLEHSLDLLSTMNIPWPHSVAMLGKELVGYALVMAPELISAIPTLGTLATRLENISVDGIQVASSRFYIMGQVCVAAGHRGQGLIARLYEHQAAQMAPNYDCSITEVNAANALSLRAHKRTGWRAIDSYEEQGQTWVILLLRLDPFRI